MKDNTMAFAVMFSILLTLVALTFISINSSNNKALAGLQECVVTSSGNTYVVWQKDCK